MKKPVKVSVVIPAYNEEGYIGRLLENLTEQSFKDFDVVVADAKSTDKTVEVVNGFKDRLSVKVVEAPPKNPGAGRNNGVKASDGEWLLFLDADVSTNDRHLIEVLIQRTELNGWNTSSARMNVIKQRSLRDRSGTRFYYLYLKFLAHTKHPIGPGACIFTRRAVFEKYNGFNEAITFGEDNDYVTRTAKEGFGFIDETYYYVDLRRRDEEGVRFLLKNVRNEFHRLTHGFKLEKTPFEYEFGKHHKKD